MTYAAHLGIDPGVSGGLCLMVGADFVDARKMPKEPVEIVALMREFRAIVTARSGRKIASREIAATIEHVWSQPGQGHTGAFTFGRNYGTVIGIVCAFGFDLRGVVPRKWQGAMECRTGGDKNVSKARAVELFPVHAKTITHATADCMLIAEWSRLYRKD